MFDLMKPIRIVRISVTVLLLVTGVSVFAQPAKRTAEPIIDVHLHAFSSDPRWNARTPNPVTHRPLTATNEAAHMAETLAQLNKYNIAKAVLSGDYEAVLRWSEAQPNRFLIGYSFEDVSKVDLDFLRREYAAGRLKVIGEIGTQYEGLAPNDPRLEPIFALAEELDIPVAYHIHPGPQGAVYLGSPRMRQTLNSPLLLEDVLVKHPKLRLYVMHAGYPRVEEMINMLYAYPQLYVDVGVIDWTRSRAEFHTYLRRIVDAGFGERIMFGSDQMVWSDAIGMAVEGVRSARFLTAKQKRNIFYNNAVRFFRLEH
jgi:predicted TIM-barrel fold metal-dependent hydrolase